MDQLNHSRAFFAVALKKHLELFFEEDDLSRNFYYLSHLPKDRVTCQIKFKSDMVIAGLEFFLAAFDHLGANIPDPVAHNILAHEGRNIKAGSMEISFDLPFAIALTGERIALNLLQRASSIATYTRQYIDLVKASGKQIAILDTRKTTPGLRFLEKYAVRVGGGLNHRLGQTDLWMVKDNHKSFFGGVAPSIGFFKGMGTFYNQIEMEIHGLEELKQAIDLGIRHVMLDNFSRADVEKAVALKPPGMTYEISGGVRLSNLKDYLIDGIDAISVGALTYDAPHSDISFKYQKATK